MTAPLFIEVDGSWLQVQHIMAVSPSVVYNRDTHAMETEEGRCAILFVTGVREIYDVTVSHVLERIRQAAELARGAEKREVTVNVMSADGEKEPGPEPEWYCEQGCTYPSATCILDHKSGTGPAAPDWDHEHVAVHHRDGREPWCPKCGLTADGKVPSPRFPGQKSPTPKPVPHKAVWSNGSSSICVCVVGEDHPIEQTVIAHKPDEEKSYTPPATGSCPSTTSGD